MSKRTTFITLIGITALLVALGIFFFASQKPQEIRQKAAVPGGSASVMLSPKSRTIIQGAKTSILLSASILNTSVDGFQVVASISGKIPADITFIPTIPIGMRQIGGTLTAIQEGKQIQLAYITDNPESQPFLDPNFITLGSLVFTAPGSGDMTVSFDPTLSKIHQHSEQNLPGSDILDLPEEQTYSFTPPPTPTSTPTPTPTPSPTPRPLPTPTLTPTPTPKPTPTPSPTPRPVPTSTPTPTPKPRPTTIPTPTPTPLPNHSPVISLSVLSRIAKFGKPYDSLIAATDVDLEDTLTITATGFPKGISQGPCSQTNVGGATQITCSVTGTSRSMGIYTVQIRAQDNHGGVSNKSTTLFVLPLP